ncbi:MAG TPA: PQQ-dependent sugar dehydrogenase [Steroidobacteraceae bacterium]|nr:PQQ-dependent sugar dehydrogenase [Steroidobacteraceae bacterium]
MRASTSRIATGVLCQALLAYLAGCGGGDGSSPNPSPPAPAPAPTPNPAPVPAPPPTPTPSPPPTSGLDARPSNTSCLAGAAPGTGVSLDVQRVFSKLPAFTQPIAMLQAPDDAAHWYVVQKTGQVRVFDNTADVSSARTFIDISGKLNSNPDSSNDERGLLGMAFHPDYPTDPRVYLFYTGTDSTLGLVDRVAEFRTTDGGGTLSPGTELVLFNVDDPESNHNGGNIAFGPDGFLYIGIGDGGGGGDMHGSIGNGQRLTTLLGKMLRIDIASSTQSEPYEIPDDNPFAGNARCNTNGTGTANCPEIYAYGFRNPWRWSFDRATGELWLNDVGQSTLEEVDKVTRGGNYGWRCFEGDDPFNSTCGSNPDPIPPLAQYGRSLGYSTTGGFVYRGSAIPNLQGRYVFGDFGSGNLWHIARDTKPTLTLDANSVADATGLSIASFAQDTDGELYIVHLGGTLHKIVPAAGGGGSIATNLSDTGCVNPANPSQPAAGLIPYAPNAPFYSDGALKDRWLALPNGQRIVVDDTSGDFDFPSGSVLMKNFSLGGQLVETRLFMRHDDGNWAGYTYEWNAQHTDATRVIGGKAVQVGGQTWDFPSEAQCLQCHNAAAGRTLGLEIGQLNGELEYPATGRTANQLATLDGIDTLTPALADPPDQLPVVPDPAGDAPLGERARAYLHSNCGYCHRPGGAAQSDMDLRYATALSATQACNITPTLGDLGIPDARLIAPGSAARSVVVARMNRTGTDAMPPLARHSIDTDGVQLISDWIDSLSGCT